MRILLPAAGLALAWAAAPAMAQTAAEREACMADFEKYCPGVLPGGGRVMACLSDRLDQLAPQCKTVVEAHRPK